MNLKDYWFCWRLIMVILLAANIGMYLAESNLSILTWRDYFKFSAQEAKNLTRHAVQKSVLAGTRNLKTAQNLTKSLESNAVHAPKLIHTMDTHSIPKLEYFDLSKSVSVVKLKDIVEKLSIQKAKIPTESFLKATTKNKTIEKRPIQIKETRKSRAETTIQKRPIQIKKAPRERAEKTIKNRPIQTKKTPKGRADKTIERRIIKIKEFLKSRQKKRDKSDQFKSRKPRKIVQKRR